VAIAQKFPYFAEMHRFLATRSSITPPAVTTGVGPQGRKVVHLQAPDKNRKKRGSNSVLPVTPAKIEADIEDDDDVGSSPVSIDSSPLVPAPKGRAKTAAQASSFNKAIAKVSKNLRPTKASFEDKLADLQTCV
jgi:hypothetical protein